MNGESNAASKPSNQDRLDALHRAYVYLLSLPEDDHTDDDQPRKRPSDDQHTTDL